MSYQNYNRRNNSRRPGYRPRKSGRGGRIRITRRMRNRAIIIAGGLLIFALIIVLISTVFSCVCSGGSGGSQIDTATKGAATVDETAAKDTISFREPNITADENAEPGFTVNNELYIWNKTAFELFYGSEKRAKAYASFVNSAKKSLGSGVKVYTMVIPNHTEMGLPGQFKSTENGMLTESQADYIKKVYVNLKDNVGYVNAYNALSKHCNEYIYFDSDHHWTGLGAYYAYKSFASLTKQPAVGLSKLQENTIEGFTGSFTKVTSADLNVDTVHYWDFPYKISDTLTNEDGETEKLDSCYYKAAQGGDSSYGVFLYGDNPLEVIKSASKRAKGKIAIIHESYGNALVPYFTYNYKEIYSIDFRSWKGSLKELCKKKGITEVLFANGVMSSATAFQVNSMKSIIN